MRTTQHFYESVELPKMAIHTFTQIFFLRNFFQKADLFQKKLKAAEAYLACQLPTLHESIGPVECYLIHKRLTRLHSLQTRPQQ